MSGLTYAGSVPIGAMCPLVVSAQAATLANVQARIAGLIALQARVNLQPPSVNASITAVAAIGAQLQAAAQLHVAFPAPTLQLAALAALVATLEASIAVLLQLQGLFGASAYAWTFTGTGPELGPALAAELATGWPDGKPPVLPAYAVVLAATSSADVNALKAFFGGLP
jgi:hypothetical protein